MRVMLRAEWSEGRQLKSTASPPAARECSVRVVSDYDSFLDLEPVWNALVEQAPIDHPFLRHEWVRTWWDCFGAENALHVLVISAGEEPIAIAPLMVSRERMYGMTVRRLGFIQNDHTPRCDVIISRRPEEAYGAIWRAIVAEQGLWDVLVLCQLPAGSPTIDALTTLAAQDRFKIGVWRSTDSPYVPFTGGWEDYVRGLSRNHRAKVRKGLNRLMRLGPVHLEAVSDGDQLAGALQDGLRIEAAAWKGRSGTAMSSRPDVERFYTRLATRAARLGALRLLFLTAGRARIAFAYALFHRDKLYVLKAGYDPAYARYSPYNLLCYLVFQDGFARGLREYEFLGGNEPWKLDWTQDTRPHYWLFVFPRGLRARLLYAIKFSVVPALQRQRLYLFVRGALASRRPRNGPVTRRTPTAGGRSG